ncbi:MAG: diguanylate cyclase [Nitrospirae bacterium]|nr:diguanylate cyclase [Nitrospirota bacterium]
MTYQFLDIQSITKAFESLSHLTGLNYFLYDDRRHLLIASTKEDALLSSIKSHKKGQEIYNNFIDRYLNHSLRRKDPLIVQGPTGQYHIFIPLHYKGMSMVVLSESFYASTDDFKKFYREKGSDFGLTENNIPKFLKDIQVVPLEKIKSNTSHIKEILEILISAGYEKGDLKKQHQWSKTIINLISNVKSDTPMKDIYKAIIDLAIFLFNVDTAAVFVQGNGSLHAEISSGRLRSVIKKIELSDKDKFVREAITSNRPVSVIDSRHLWHDGLPEEVISMYLFPISPGSGFFNILGIFNTLLDKESFDSISEICRLLAHICNAKYMAEKFEKHSETFKLASQKISQLYFLHKDPQRLYNSIVHEASDIVGAEKCSLMLPDTDKSVLRVNAVKGITKWLMDDIRVRTGEGIAGKAFKQGFPILIENKEMFKDFGITPKPSFNTYSCVSLPLKIEDETIGILNLSDKNSGAPFSEEDISMLSPFILQTSLLLKLAFCHITSGEMEHLSMTDPLTGLFNRRYFDVRFEEEFQRSKRFNMPFSLAMVDIDDFKIFNDTEGHLAGDDILKEVASSMNSVIRANDIIVRYGGEEFAIIMPQTKKAEAFYVAERIRKITKNMIPPTWKKYPKGSLTVSIGIAMFPDCGEPISQLIKCADMALYKAKRLGKNITAVWNNLIGDVEDTKEL